MKMSISDVKNNLNSFILSKTPSTENVYTTLECVYTLLNVFALKCVRRAKNGGLESHYSATGSVLAGTVLTAISLSTLYARIQYSYSGLSITVKATDCLQSISDYAEYALDVYTSFVCGRVYLNHYFQQYETVDSILNVKQYSAAKKVVKRLILRFTLAFLVICVVDFVSWALLRGIFQASVFAPAYIYVYIRLLILLEFSSHVLILKCRLKFLANRLHGLYYDDVLDSEDGRAESDPLMNEHCLSNKLYFRAFKMGKCTNSGYRRGPECIRQLSRCYLLLMEQRDYLNKAYGTRILLCFFNLFADMIRWLNVAFLVASNYWPGHERMNLTIPAVISCALRIILSAALLLCVVMHCEQSYSQRERIIRVLDYTLNSKTLSPRYRTAVLEMRALASSRTLMLTAADVFRLHYPLLHGLLSAMATYTVIITQMASSAPPPTPAPPPGP